MCYSLSCHQCDHRKGYDEPAHSYHDSEGEALEARWQHIEDTGHGEIYLLGGAYFIGDGPRPRRLPGSGDRFEPLDVDDPPSSRMWPEGPPGRPSKWKAVE